MIDELLKKYNLKYEDLNADEKETLSMWMSSLEQGQVSVDKIREFIHAMRDAVEQELTKCDLGNKNDLFLKARLRNYMLLEAFLSNPEKAKQAIERSIAAIAKR